MKNVILGGKIHEKPVPIIDLIKSNEEHYGVVLEGELFDVSERGPFKNGNRLYEGSIYDGTHSTYYKFFTPRTVKLTEGMRVRIEGDLERDSYKWDEFVLTVKNMMEVPSTKEEKKDEASEKRVELSTIGQYSMQLSSMKAGDLIDRAKAYGHEAVAITDHSAIQGFPEAYRKAKEEEMKLIYGMTVNMVDDEIPLVLNADSTPLSEVTFTSYDVESTGLSTEDDHLIEIGATKFAPTGEVSCHECGWSQPLKGFTNLDAMDIEIDPRILKHKEKLNGDLSPQAFLKKGVCPTCFGFPKKQKILKLTEARKAVEDEKATKTLSAHKAIDRFQTFIRSPKPITPFITELTSITQEQSDSGVSLEEAIEGFHRFHSGTVLVGQNIIAFDNDMLESAYRRCERESPPMIVADTLIISRNHNVHMKRHGLKDLAKEYGVPLEKHHRADQDAEATGHVFARMIIQLLTMDVTTLEAINTHFMDEDYYQSFFADECTILVQNETGLKNLQHLVSLAHDDFLGRTPLLPKRIINRYREGLLIGSGSYNGRLFDIAMNKPSHLVEEEAAFYDYIEINPSALAEHLVKSNKAGSMESIDRSWKTIILSAKRLMKPIVATGYTHYLDEEDRLPQQVLAYYHSTGAHHMRTGHMDALSGSHHFRTTDEMMESFPYLSDEEKRAYIVNNPKHIADQCSMFSPLPDELFTPDIPGVNEELENETLNTARAWYGDPIPENIQKRLDKELKSIIGNGFAVIYTISRDLVKKSLEDGYIVGSRGSIGSSLVATFVGITEVNPLKPHYNCRSCRWSVFFDHEDMQSGYDLPSDMRELFQEERFASDARKHFFTRFVQSLGEDKTREIAKSHTPGTCPCCGAEGLKREGQDIPFETFLGFKGDKIPDIDLNFAGGYQPRAHDYTGELFGRDKVFRAGTIGTVADKKGELFVFKYMKEHQEHYQKEISDLTKQLKTASGESKSLVEERISEFKKKLSSMKWSRAEQTRVGGRIKGAKITTGQHPGGMLVVPADKDMDDFGGSQFPANDKNSPFRTTHYDFHSIHDNILKLDILGHDDPDMLRLLQDLTGIAPKDVPPNDELVLKLFTDPEKALGVPIEAIEAETGTLGVPEFGTKFVMEMIKDTQPKTFAELVKISGLSHGTDVWLNNAQEYVREGICTLKDVIDTRDTIMVRLIQLGIDPQLAFTIMERVRKGKGLTDESWEPLMKEHGTPDWFIESCKKIKYMFPKAHAAAYVLSAMRIAYFKVYHPIHFYAADLTARQADADIQEVSLPTDQMRARIRELQQEVDDKKSKKQTTSNEEGKIKYLKRVHEAKVRGIKFGNIRMYGSHAVEWTIDGDTIIPPFASLPGVGMDSKNGNTPAAWKLYNTSREGVFRGTEDLRKRSGISNTVIDTLRKLGCLKDIEAIRHVFF
ncbi:PHP domain-containing protein (plasmid) [Pontibacillus sp. ALD_SL1]|nr:exonuclease domain-containing protein [Pontibacillus sp. ALD_SL1]QST02825.1 PHP domain-containing protein [Pontibacillus sp. ALD_SL1]